MKYKTIFLAITASTAMATQPEFETVYWDTVLKNGDFSGGKLLMRTHSKQVPARSGIAGVTTLIDNGPPSNRIDLVFVGDGYRVSDLNSYESHVNNALDAFFDIEPMESYMQLFNVHRVDVISNETGVDNDPYGVYRDTAMDMTFWCNNTERLLCVDTSLAWGFANNVPSVDAILAVANSSKYGGAGYSWAEIGTFSGANDASTDVAIHEFGHSMGDLADEYDYGGSTTYDGPEPSTRNVSIYNSTQMASGGYKWANWLGENDPAWDGLCSTYEGAMYSEYGIYRPSNNSMMRALNRPFNQASAEGFIIEFYKIVRPLDGHTNFGVLYADDNVFIDPIELGHALSIQWFLNDEPLDVSGHEFSIASLNLPSGTHSLNVEIVDPTPWVRDEEARESIMKQLVGWPVQIDEVDCSADITGDGSVGIGDLLAVIDAWGNCTNCPADITGDNQVNVADLLAVIDAWGVCP